VLPFTDRGSANFVVDKIRLTYSDQQQRASWAWTDAQRLRRRKLLELCVCRPPGVAGNLNQNSQ
jgi:hypothetical protein